MSVITIHQQRELERRQRNLQRFLVGGLVLLLSVGAAMLVANDCLKSSARSYMYDDVARVPQRKTALLLGTNKWLAKSKKNEYFTNRMEAAALLYNNKKIDKIIVSGDSSRYYNEPEEMTAALVALGVPSTAIYPDFAGFRTYDSMYRCKKKYNQKNIIIITQKFHAYRAVFIARALGINAVSYNAETPKEALNDSHLREFWARLGAIFDVYLFHTKPRNVGQPTNINI